MPISWVGTFEQPLIQLINANQISSTESLIDNIVSAYDLSIKTGLPMAPGTPAGPVLLGNTTGLKAALVQFFNIIKLESKAAYIKNTGTLINVIYNDISILTNKINNARNEITAAKSILVNMSKDLQLTISADIKKEIPILLEAVNKSKLAFEIKLEYKKVLLSLNKLMQVEQDILFKISSLRTSVIADIQKELSKDIVDFSPKINSILQIKDSLTNLQSIITKYANIINSVDHINKDLFIQYKNNIETDIKNILGSLLINTAKKLDLSQLTSLASSLQTATKKYITYIQILNTFSAELSRIKSLPSGILNNKTIKDVSGIIYNIVLTHFKEYEHLLNDNVNISIDKLSANIRNVLLHKIETALNLKTGLTGILSDIRNMLLDTAQLLYTEQLKFFINIGLISYWTAAPLTSPGSVITFPGTCMPYPLVLNKTSNNSDFVQALSNLFQFHLNTVTGIYVPPPPAVAIPFVGYF